MVPPAGRRLVAPADVSRGECRGAGRREEVGEAVGQGPTLLPDARWGVRRRLPDTTRPPPCLRQRVGPGRHCGGGDTRRAVGGAEVVLAAGAAAALAGRIDKGGRTLAAVLICIPQSRAAHPTHEDPPIATATDRLLPALNTFSTSSFGAAAVFLLT